MADIRPLVVGPAYYTTRTIAGGQTLQGGSVLGVITASGKLKLCDSAAADGSQTAKYILTRDVDASGGDITVKVLKAGVVNAAKLIFGGSDTLADHDDELRDVGIVAVETTTLEA